jgi:hypothetical protein
LSLLVLSLGLTGCGGKAQYYTPEQVSAALDSQGLTPDFFAGLQNNAPGPGRFQAAIPDAPPAHGIRPLSNIVGGIVSAFHVPTAAKVRLLTVLPRRVVYALVFARTGDAQKRAAVFLDQLTAERIMGDVEFGFARRGNVVVTYRLFGGSFPRLRGVGIRREGIFDPGEYNADVERRVVAALDSLP